MPRIRPAPFVLFVALLLLPALLYADGRKVWNLGLRPPAEILRVEGDARRAYAQVAVDHLTKRLEAAGIKQFTLSVTDAETVRLEVGVSRDDAWMEALLTAPGRLELRPVLANTPNWVELARTLPAGIEIRGNEDPWLWGARRQELERWLERITVVDVTVMTFPADGGGVRTVSLGAPVGTERNLRKVKVQRSTTGSSYLEVSLDAATGASLAALPESGVQQVAIVLDGEVIGVVPTATLRADNRLRISVPREAVADDRKLREAWIQQVAGRLAAPFPVPIAVLKE